MKRTACCCKRTRVVVVVVLLLLLLVAVVVVVVVVVAAAADWEAATTKGAKQPLAQKARSPLASGPTATQCWPVSGAHR
jgi:flagellar basal body-associated protein FliL